jgi:Mrp family chromosome partitioning ATPase
MESLDGYVIVAQDGKTTQREVESAADMLGHEKLAGVVLNKYRGGLVSEGYGIEDRYAGEYYANRESDDEL